MIYLNRNPKSKTNQNLNHAFLELFHEILTSTKEEQHTSKLNILISCIPDLSLACWLRGLH